MGLGFERDLGSEKALREGDALKVSEVGGEGTGLEGGGRGGGGEWITVRWIERGGHEEMKWRIGEEKRKSGK